MLGNSSIHKTRHPTRRSRSSERSTILAKRNNCENIHLSEKPSGKEASVSSKTTRQQIMVMTWNVEGLESVKRLMPTNILTSDVIILTEAFNTCETSLKGYYTYETLRQREHGKTKWRHHTPNQTFSDPSPANP
ncbi:hypothetical protein ANN_28052 [Periplaneta americana]|uniref:Uncharacterized protein n=1 Tax=Periplaneta americana TaxID=6978 RepID=A0ABQ8RUU8_PERAM|nr:hypothetical protein ANN_28052 [Periplaneta americana]